MTRLPISLEESLPGSTSPTSSTKELIFLENLVTTSPSILQLMQSSKPSARACRNKRIQERPVLFTIQSPRLSLITL
ncbi:hypothetical protein Golob_017937 [Gossypium lobatum]|uniref:Uncharacterized protein n=1 Tax=Gossypium lobatum TaxID=34289 RepID=A0A7J8M8T8_9ROSI|nr:hypothetical protein [Gossypium lobatum]